VLGRRIGTLVQGGLLRLAEHPIRDNLQDDSLALAGVFVSPTLPRAVNPLLIVGDVQEQER
jgi:hypothetical protein